MECVESFVNEIPFNAETSMDVVCEKVEGTDGKIYWAPKDAGAVAAFVQAK